MFPSESLNVEKAPALILTGGAWTAGVLAEAAGTGGAGTLGVLGTEGVVGAAGAVGATGAVGAAAGADAEGETGVTLTDSQPENDSAPRIRKIPNDDRLREFKFFISSSVIHQLFKTCFHRPGNSKKENMDFRRRSDIPDPFLLNSNFEFVSSFGF